jgi:hypothetical protein
MGLDVYVGPLSRYYTQDWETVVQKHGRLSGLDVRVVRPSAPAPRLIDRVLGVFRPNPSAQEVVEMWQREVGRRAKVPVAWDEDPAREYFTDKSTWDCYGSLLLWAAYHERGLPELPGTSAKWAEDPVLNAALRDEKSAHANLLCSTELWLPAEIARPLEVPTPSGQAAIVGSVAGLATELRHLNSITWQAEDADISAWRRDSAEFEAPLEVSARFAFAVFLELSELAVQHRLPMKLDY